MARTLRSDSTANRKDGHKDTTKRKQIKSKQPTDRAASQRLQGGRLPLRPIQTSLIKLSYCRRAEEGLPVGTLVGLPRRPHVLEEQASWRLEDPGLAWAPNSSSTGERKEFVQAKFEEDVEEPLRSHDATKPIASR